MPHKFDKATLEKLVSKGLLKKETIDGIPNFANGGVVPAALSPVPDVVPDIATMPVPEAAKKALLKSPHSFMSDEEWSALDPQTRLLSESPDLAMEFGEQRGGLVGAGLQKLGEFAADTRNSRKQRLIESGLMQPDAVSEPLVEVDQAAIPASHSGPETKGMQYENNAAHLMEQALLTNMEANADEAAATQSSVNDAQHALLRQQQLEDKLNAERALKMDAAQQKVDLAAQEYTSAKIDPDRIWANKSTGTKIGTAISLFFAGINGSDAGVQILNNAIDRDIEAQKADMASKKLGFDMQRGILSDMMARFGDERQASSAAKLTQIQMAELKLKGQLAKIQGTRAYAEGLEGLAKLQQLKAKTQQQFQLATLASSGFQSDMKFEQAYFSLPEEYQKSAVKLPGNKLGIATDSESAKAVRKKLEAIDNIEQGLAELEKLTSFRVLPTEKKAEAEAIAGSLLGQIKEAGTLGTLDKGVESLVQKQIGDPNSFFSGAAKSRIAKTKEIFKQQKERALSQHIIGYRPLDLRKK